MVQYQLTERQQLSVSYSVNDVVSRENEQISAGGMSRIHNGGISYSVQFPQHKMAIAPMFNATQSTVSEQHSYLLGPSLNINKLFLSDKLTATLGSSYNYGKQPSGSSQNAIFRMGLTYVLFKRHQFRFSAVQSFHKSVFATGSQSRNELTINFGYNYHFEKIPLLSAWNLGGMKSDKQKTARQKTTAVDLQGITSESLKETTETALKIKLKHNKQRFEGTPEVITQKLISLTASENYAELRYMLSMQQRLDSLAKEMTAAHTDASRYKKEATHYFELLDQVKQKERELSQIVFGVLNKLYVEAIAADERIKQRVLDSKRNLEEQENPEQEQSFENSFEMFVIHHQMKKDFYGLSVAQVAQPQGVIKEFLDQNKTAIYQILDDAKQSKSHKINAIQLLITDFYYKKYKGHTQ